MTVVLLYGLFDFCIFPSKHLLGFFANVMKGCAAFLCVYYAFCTSNSTSMMTPGLFTSPPTAS